MCLCTHPLILIIDEDGRLPQRKREELHDQLARRSGLQRHHSQAQVAVLKISKKIALHMC